jgi:hypothetical protein
MVEDDEREWLRFRLLARRRKREAADGGRRGGVDRWTLTRLSDGLQQHMQELGWQSVSGWFCPKVSL